MKAWSFLKKHTSVVFCLFFKCYEKKASKDNPVFGMMVSWPRGRQGDGRGMTPWAEEATVSSPSFHTEQKIQKCLLHY